MLQRNAWRRVLLVGLAGSMVLEPKPVEGQVGWVKSNQLAIDSSGPYSLSISYAQRAYSSRLSIGGSVGFNYDLDYRTFNREMFFAPQLLFFGRYQPRPWLQLEGGPLVFSYYWTDDCSECSGRFLGVQVGTGIGTGLIFAGMTLRLGVAQDEPHGVALGAIWLPFLRLMISWES